MNMHPDERIMYNQIDQLEAHINKLALATIERYARRLLIANHKSLKEFIMGMGAAFFTNQRDGVIPHGQLKYLKTFESVVEDLNERFKVCGVPMRFTATGKRITNW